MALVKTKVDTPAADGVGSCFSLQSVTNTVICKGPDKLASLLEAIEKYNVVSYVSDGDWSMHDLVMMLLKKYQPAALYITTYALREYPVRQIIQAMDRKEIFSLFMAVDYKAKMRTPEVFQLASLNASKIFLTHIHAKITVIHSEAGSITIVGSSNWTTNPRIEAGTVFTDAGVSKFYVDIIQKVIDNAEIFN